MLYVPSLKRLQELPLKTVYMKIPINVLICRYSKDTEIL